MQSIQTIDKLNKRDAYNAPIILLDYSASVMASFYDRKRIIDHLVDLIKQAAQYDQFDEAHIILWSANVDNLGFVSINDLDANNLIMRTKLEPSTTNFIPVIDLLHNLVNKLYYEYDIPMILGGGIGGIMEIRRIE